MVPETPVTGRSFLGTLALVSVAMGGFVIIDSFLMRMERAEDRSEAARLFAEGRKLLEQGRNADAIERLSDAAAIERDNRDYSLALAEGLLAAGKPGDAESRLSDLLQQDSTDGRANLMMARVMIREGKIPEGISFYHRAIYGKWKSRSRESRVGARFELVDLLVRQNAREDLLAELLPLQDEAPADLATQKKIGRLFIVAGSPSHAGDVFRAILRRYPQNPDAYAGLAEEEFAAGNYQTAQRDFLSASRLNPTDEAIRKWLDRCDQILLLDPTRRGLASSERYGRSVKLLKMTVDQTNQCAGNTASANTPVLLDQASKALKRPVPANRQSEASELNVDLAEQIWQARKKDCPLPDAEPGDPLVLVLKKVSQ